MAQIFDLISDLHPISSSRAVISRGFTFSKLNTRGFRYLPDYYMAHGADLLSDR